MNEEIIKRLSAYSLFTSVNLLMFTSVKGEVILTDIDPDTILDQGAEFCALDIDNNNTLDFAFLNTSATTYDLTLGYISLQSLLVGPYVISNALAGISHYYFYSGGSRFLPFALASGEIIGPDLSWQMIGIQYLAWETYRGGYDDHCNHCDWANDTLIETTDHYLGIRFSDSDGNRHYGWVRCDVKDYGHILVIKDYAYETEINQPISAGSKTTYHNIYSSTLSGDMYSSGNVVYINISSRPELEFTFNVYDMTGKLVYTEILQNAICNVPLAVSNGVYLMEIHCDKCYLNKTMFIKR